MRLRNLGSRPFVALLLSALIFQAGAAAPAFVLAAEPEPTTTRAMPDSEFFGLWNLRASCRRHNTARGVAARLAREVGEAEPVPAFKRGVIRWGQ